MGKVQVIADGFVKELQPTVLALLLTLVLAAILWDQIYGRRRIAMRVAVRREANRNALRHRNMDLTETQALIAAEDAATAPVVVLMRGTSGRLHPQG